MLSGSDNKTDVTPDADDAADDDDDDDYDTIVLRYLNFVQVQAQNEKKKKS